MDVKGWRGGQSPALATGDFFDGGKGGETLGRGVRSGKGVGRGGGRSHRQESMAAGIGAAPLFASTFTLHRIYVSARFPGRCSSPAGRNPSEPPKREGDSPSCRGMGAGGGVSEGSGLCSGAPSAGAGRGPGPGATRWQAAPIPIPIPLPPHPGPGAGPPGSPASPLRSASSARDRLSVPASLGKPRGTRAKGSFATRGDGGDGLRRLRDKILPFPSLPPALLVSFCFSFLFLFSPIPLQRAACFSLARFKRQGCKTRQMHPPNAG